MENNITQTPEYLLELIVNEAFDEKPHNFGVLPKCADEVNFERRRFFILSSLSELEEKERFSSHKSLLESFTMRAIAASGCSEMVVVLKDIVKLIESVK